MIPLKDDIKHRSFPYVNIALIAINIAVFIFELVIGDRLSRVLHANAFVPADYTVGFTQALDHYGFAKLLYSPFVSMFLHGSVVHIVGNMLFLFVFGDNVEDRLGHFRYLAFYVLCGLAATAVHFLANPVNPFPIIGASGAIAGVLGAYLVLFPKARILTRLRGQWRADRKIGEKIWGQQLMAVRAARKRMEIGWAKNNPP